jgi:membrane fusion protein (multidrug efflux system)
MMAGFTNRLVGIEAKKVTTGTTQKEVRSIGVLKAKSEVVLKSEIPGKIEDILFEEGGNVKEGQPLIKFEPTYFEAEVERHKAECVAMESEYERAKRLYGQNAGSRKALDEALARKSGAKAQLDEALYQLSKTEIKAPFDGRIGILMEGAAIGNIVQQHAGLVRIIDDRMMWVEFRVAAKNVADLSVGQAVEVTVDAYPGKTFIGTVDAIDSTVDPRNHSILVRAVIPNENGELKHGMFANVKLITGEKSGVVLISGEALDREGAIEFVWVVDEKKRVYRKRVLTGAKDMSGIEILAGLKEGEIIVITGQLKLTDGTKVKILNEADFEEASEESEDGSKDDLSKKDKGKEPASGTDDGKVTSLDEQTLEQSDGEDKSKDANKKEDTSDDETEDGKIKNKTEDTSDDETEDSKVKGKTEDDIKRAEKEMPGGAKQSEKIERKAAEG